MNDFNNETINQKPLDPYKRVRYSMGLVLGVDEFEQEQLYFLEKNRLHNRALHGYGTVCGLNVLVRDKTTKSHDNIKYPEVVVTSGIAVAPAGQEIRVPATQCGDIGQWFERNQAGLKKSIENGKIRIYVVLCYRECERDRVPVPGVPCRSQEESMVASRIEDYFELKLSLTPPLKPEEKMVRQFGDLLARIEITPDSADYTDSAELEEMVKNLGKGEPGTSGIYLRPEDARSILRNAFRIFVTQVRPAVRDGECVPADGDCVCLAAIDIPAILKDDDKVYLDLTEDSMITIDMDDRPILLHTRLLQEWLLCGKPGMSKVSPRSFATLFTMAPGKIRAWVHHNSTLEDIPENALAIKLNDVTSNIDGVNRVSADANVFDISFSDNNDESPEKVNNGDTIKLDFDTEKIYEASPHGRLLDVLDGMQHPYLERNGNTLTAYLIVDLPSLSSLSDVALGSPLLDGDVLVRRDGTWTSGKLKHDELAERGDDDHTQYLLADGTRSLSGDLGAGSHKITSLAKATTKGDAVRFNEAVTVETNDDGDLVTPPDTDGQILTWNGSKNIWEPGLQQLNAHSDVEIANDALNEKDILVWNKNKQKWVAGQQQGQAKILRYLPFVTITRTTYDTGGIPYEVWFNIDAPDNEADIKLDPEYMQVFQEEKKPKYLTKLPYKLKKIRRNVFMVILEKEAEYLRFVFYIPKMTLIINTDEMSVIDYAKKNSIAFMGFDGKETITSFVKGITNIG